MKVAVTALLAVIITVQLPVPEHPPLQPPKVDPPAGAALSVTVVPLAYASEQSDPQLTPAGLLVIEPAPAPVLVAVRVYVGGGAGAAEKVAVTVTGVFPAIVHGSVPVHPPPVQPAKVEPLAGVVAESDHGARIVALEAVSAAADTGRAAGDAAGAGAGPGVS